MKTIVVLPGHSYKDPGTTNKKIGVEEFDWCADVVTEILKDDSWEDISIVAMTRNKNYSTLPSQINDLNPDYIVELHLNSAVNPAQGTETLYCSASTRSKRIAEIFQKNMVDALGYRDRGVKPKKKNEDGGHLLWGTKAPCVILEPFFLHTIEDIREVNREGYIKAIKRSIREVVDKNI